MTSPPPRLTAAILDRYRVERQLGAGGMATVYLARDVRHHREVALKVLRPELAAVLGAERFLNEIRISAQLDHPHILTLIDSGADDTFLWYVLPYVRGESLRAKLARETQLSLEESLLVTKQIASALDYAHQRGVIHRDIKPENILLHEGEAVLADFGIALAVKEAGGNRLTETGLSLGTPQYMSPEQATGEQMVDARSDIYSLGAVLFEMLTGEPPHTGPNAHAVIAKLMTERPMRIRTVRDTVPEALDSAVAKALAKVPADRFATAGAFATAVATAASAGPGAVAAHVTARRGVKVAAVAAGVVALAATTIYLAQRGTSIDAPFALDLLQLTTDGNARQGVLSPDGSRLAYVARDCDARGQCSMRLVVKDTGGAGSVTLLRSSTISGVSWTTGGRFVVALAQDSTQFGSIAVPALGGPPRFLGVLAYAIGTTDTVMVSNPFADLTDSVTVFRLVTVSDGIVRDSLRVRNRMSAAGPSLRVGMPGRSNGLTALMSMTGPSSGEVTEIVDRRGRMTDSASGLTIQGVGIVSVSWSRDDDALIWTTVAAAVGVGPLAATDAPSSRIVRQRITSAGRFLGPPDTLATLPAGTMLGAVSEDGTAMLEKGQSESEVFALERPRPGSLTFQVRSLAASTAGLNAFLSRDGAWVWLARSASEGAGGTSRNAFVPFEGGTERLFAVPPGEIVSRDWTRPVSTALVLTVPDSAGAYRLFEIQVATGQARQVAEIPIGFRPLVFTLPGGGYAYPAGEVTGELHVRGRPGQADTSWTAALLPGRRGAIAAVTPEGGAFLSWTYNARSFDTGFYHLTPARGGPARAVFWNTAGWILPDGIPTLLTDGSLEFVRGEPGGVVWYRVAPGGTRETRLGAAPIRDATSWSISQDGRRAIAVKSVSRPDAYVIRNFGELLRRR